MQHAPCKVNWVVLSHKARYCADVQYLDISLVHIYRTVRRGLRDQTNTWYRYVDVTEVSPAAEFGLGLFESYG